MAAADRTDLWTDDEVATLRRLFADGASDAEIAEALKRTRVQVSKKRERLALMRRTNQTRLYPQKPEPKPLPKPVREADLEPFEMRLVTIADLGARDCRWPLGDPGDLETFRYCGNRAGEGDSYCLHHFQVAYSSASAARAEIKARQMEQKRRAQDERGAVAAGFACV